MSVRRFGRFVTAAIAHVNVSSNRVCRCATNVAAVKQRVSSFAKWMARRKPTCICAKNALAPFRLGWIPKRWGSRSASSVEERHSVRSPVHRQVSTPAASAGQPMLGSSLIFAPESVPSCWTGAKATSSSSRCAVTPNWRPGRIKSVAKQLRSSEEADQMIQATRGVLTQVHGERLRDRAPRSGRHDEAQVFLLASHTDPLKF